MSLYGLQKLLFALNRDPAVQHKFVHDLPGLLNGYDLDQEERTALETRDVGLIYVLGANGQLLMHYAALIGMEWPDYIAAMRDGVARHGPVRAGVYLMTTRMDEKVAGV